MRRDGGAHSDVAEIWVMEGLTRFRQRMKAAAGRILDSS